MPSPREVGSIRLARDIGGMIAGIVASNAVVFAVESAGNVVFPMPATPDSLARPDLSAWMHAVPLPLKLLIVCGWALGAVAGPWLALRVTDRAWTGWVVSAVFLAGSALNLATLPHPPVMVACGLVFPLVGGWLAQRLHRKPYAGEPLLG